MKPYHQSVTEVVRNLYTDSTKGLSAPEVTVRRQQYGPNMLHEVPRESLVMVFLRQFKNPLIYILLIAASIIFITGNRLDAFIISGVLFFNAIIGTIQEGRTQTLLDSLQHLIKVNAVVIRDGVRGIVSDRDVVPGDLVVLQEGVRIPADIRIAQANNLRIDEALLTGESVPVDKTADELIEGLGLADQKNMAFKGTYVISGSGTGIAVATGSATEIGRLQQVSEEIQTDMPLKRELESLSYKILLLILGMCVALLGIGLFNGRSFDELLVMLTALFICVVPEGLPVVLTLVLVTGASRMAQFKVLIKRLHGVDALGRTEIAIIDKTGTLTRNEMMVAHVWADNQEYDVSGAGFHQNGAISCNGKQQNLSPTSSVCRMAVAGSLLSRAVIKFVEQTNTFTVEGDPTEASLSVFAQKVGYKREELDRQYRHIHEIPFDATTRCHAAFYEHQGQGIAFIVGSPESLFARCAQVQHEDRQVLERMLNEGLRVVAVGMKNIDRAKLHAEPGPEQGSVFNKMLEHDIQLLGLCGIQDAIRTEVRSMVEATRSAGIRVIMATGDHRMTALYVAKRVGIYKESEGDEIVEGPVLEHLSDAELIRRIDKITVYARLTPEHKLRLVNVFHKLDKVVAMTGDGVNDAPSLVAADVGIAMGGIGTEVAKQAADVVLLDDSFANVVRAIEQGRHIFYALRRVILYFFATNMGEVFVVLFALVLNYPLPILAAQILWLNLVTDGFLDIALAMEPKETGLLKKKWLRRGAGLVNRTLMLKTVYMALPMGIGSMAVFYMYQADLEKARTMTLLTMAMYQWFNAWNCRSETKSIMEIGLFSNRWLLLATALVGFLQILVVNVPLMRTLFHTVPLSTAELLLIFAVTAPLLFIEEGRKWLVRRRSRRFH